MNGRAYDYNLGRFLSVDPFVQAPGNSQSMNPYSYIMNNPLAGTDPSGYRSICGGKGQRKCDAVIDYTGRNGHIGTYSYSGPRANGVSTNQGANSTVSKPAVTEEIGALPEIKAPNIKIKDVEVDVPIVNPGGTEVVKEVRTVSNEVLEENTRLLGLPSKMAEESAARIKEAGDAVTDRLREEQIARIHHRRNVEQQKEKIRQQKADAVVMDYFPDGVAEGHKVTVGIALAPVAVPIVVNPVTVSFITSSTATAGLTKGAISGSVFGMTGYYAGTIDSPESRTTKGFIYAGGIGAVTGGVGGWGATMSGATGYLSAGSVTWRGSMMATGAPIQHANQKVNTKK